MRRVALGLQGGGSHGAFTWGALDRMLEEVEAGRLEIAGISGASAGAINAVVTGCGLAEGGAALARARLAEVWRKIADRGAMSGNALIYGAPGPFGFNIDWNPGAIALEALGLVVSPYTNPFYRDALGPLLAEVLPAERLARLADGPAVFVTAVDVATNQRRNFPTGEISIDAIRASACLPMEFQAVSIGGDTYWDGGYLGNPALEPLIAVADELVIVMANPLERPRGAIPKNARQIMDRLNEITFNTPVVMEMNAILAVNGLLADLRAQGIDYRGKYRPIELTLVRDDPFLASLGAVSKSSTSWALLERLREAGYRAASEAFAAACDAKREVVQPVLQPGVTARPR